MLKSLRIERDLAVERMLSPIATCTEDGTLLAASDAARVLVQKATFESGAPLRHVPAALWSRLCDARVGDPIEWWPDGQVSGIRCTRYAIEADRYLLCLQELTDQKATLAHQIYRSMESVFARLISSAAHDLRSPLSSMTFNVGVLQRRAAELSPEETQRLLSEIASCCEWQKEAIDTLLEAAALTEISDVSLRPILNRIAEILRPLYRQGGHELTIELDEKLTVRGNALVLEHIFLNLLTNSVQSAAGQKITARVHVFDRDRDHVRVWIEDDGPGIQSELRSRVFDPFFSTKMNGTGMGLSLAREAARELGGELELIDDRSGGACFELRLAARRDLQSKGREL